MRASGAELERRSQRRGAEAATVSCGAGSCQKPWSHDGSALDPLKGPVQWAGPVCSVP